ncbi:MAG: hypothetical protein RTU09_04465 [Candidatus Thorarchaeota archaeon]
MDSPEQFRFIEWPMPFLAIVQVDLQNLFRSRMTYGWLIVGVFLQVIRVLSAPSVIGTSAIVVQGLGDFIFLWSMLIIGITANAVSSETGELADSIMSKSVKRHDYIMAKFTSRIMYVMTIYLLISGVLVGASMRLMENDYDTNGLIAAILLVALVLVMLTTLGVTLSMVTSNTVISIVSLLVIWYSMTIFLPLVDLGFMSPSSMIDGLLDIIQGVWNGEEWKISTSFGGISIIAMSLSVLYFSTKDL